MATKKGNSSSIKMPMSVSQMKAAEKAMESKGGPKTRSESMMEKRISNATGKSYKGKR